MIGERLEEARKRKGVSIREVAETTKIRGDYLLAMEDNSFDIPLPEIYIRGFLRNYARYLNLDSSKILTDFDAHLLGKSSRPSNRATSGSGQNSLGRVEIPDEEEEVPTSGDVPEERAVITEAPEEDGPEPELTFSLKKGTPQQPAVPQTRVLKRESSIMDQESWNENKTLYMKIGLVFAAILLISIILVIMIQMLGKDDTPELNPELATPATTQAESPVEPEPTGPVMTTSDADLITISATDSLTLIVEQTADDKRLYSGTLIAGETLSLEKEGPVSIRFSSGAAMKITKGGQQYNISQTGMGRTVIE